MAFVPAHLQVALDSIGGGALRLHSYETADTEATITASGYFADVADRGIRLGSIILVASESNGTFLAQVETMDVNGNASVIALGREWINLEDAYTFGATRGTET